MAILRVAKVWRRPLAKGSKARLDDLDAEQRKNVMAALRAIIAELGDARAVARAIGVNDWTVRRVARGECKPSAGLAVRLAKLAGVSVEDVLSGRLAQERVCPSCGQLIPHA